MVNKRLAQLMLPAPKSGTGLPGSPPLVLVQCPLLNASICWLSVNATARLLHFNTPSSSPSSPSAGSSPPRNTASAPGGSSGGGEGVATARQEGQQQNHPPWTSLLLALYNPVAWPRTYGVRLPVVARARWPHGGGRGSWGPSLRFSVQDAGGEPLSSTVQAVEASTADLLAALDATGQLQGPDLLGKGEQELVFQVTLPPLGYTTVTVRADVRFYGQEEQEMKVEKQEQEGGGEAPYRGCNSRWGP
ncbi:hypothetical protein V8C86DRAFT_268729 [Haematococcus lacustris]